ncbi:hypothetical protein BGW80DRAFT_5897 [Lactifluus volemus]|nr:hypothetical protein BGW80DRAFT_5897 [Lactifluus volemus]
MAAATSSAVPGRARRINGYTFGPAVPEVVIGGFPPEIPRATFLPPISMTIPTSSLPAVKLGTLGFHGDERSKWREIRCLPGEDVTTFATVLAGPARQMWPKYDTFPGETSDGRLDGGTTTVGLADFAEKSGYAGNVFVMLYLSSAIFKRGAGCNALSGIVSNIQSQERNCRNRSKRWS